MAIALSLHPPCNSLPMDSKTHKLDDVLDEQQRYYSARAAEYDDFWFRDGRYDCGEAENRLWFEQMVELQAVVERAGLTGDVLELAGGTGIWTERLAARAERLTVLDGSQEMLSINGKRLERQGLVHKVRYRQADLFEWQPEREFDGVFFGFWLSHVPHERLDRFMKVVSAAVRAGGTLVLVDNRRHPPMNSADQPPSTDGGEVITRQLNDGRAFQVIKRYFEPHELEELLAEHGFQADAATTRSYFVYCVARRLR